MDTLEAFQWMYILVAAISASTVGYALLLRRLAVLVHPLRLRLADVCRDILQKKLSSDDRDAVRWMLRNAFNPLVPLILAIVLPFLLLYLSLRLIFAPSTRTSSDESGIEKLKATGLFLVSVAAANPLAALVICVELTTLGFIAFLIGGTPLILEAIIKALRAEAIKLAPRGRHRAAT